MAHRATANLMLIAIIGHLLLGCCCSHADAAADKAKDQLGIVHHASPTSAEELLETATADGLLGEAVVGSGAAICCPIYGGDGRPLFHSCEDQCCTFIQSARVELPNLDGQLPALLFLISPRPAAHFSASRVWRQDIDAAPTGWPLSVSVQQWLASWPL